MCELLIYSADKQGTFYFIYFTSVVQVGMHRCGAYCTPGVANIHGLLICCADNQNTFPLIYFTSIVQVGTGVVHVVTPGVAHIYELLIYSVDI